MLYCTSFQGVYQGLLSLESPMIMLKIYPAKNHVKRGPDHLPHLLTHSPDNKSRRSFLIGFPDDR